MKGNLEGSQLPSGMTTKDTPSPLVLLFTTLLFLVLLSGFSLGDLGSGRSLAT
jgi:hypothetical protein